MVNDGMHARKPYHQPARKEDFAANWKKKSSEVHIQSWYLHLLRGVCQCLGSDSKKTSGT